ncbi:hypothetical protein [Marinobacter sp. F3R08]|uniref:hypothetical protein n=1 Tax=Marinobacter sp. F3R08 TaxID=2841559 RepID=UPI001C09AE4A|nr:hypothetical protein [Marinobacter sp. F3R08]MBU2952295.1 hypothetical protein [Marinobacter sp. F3R08]
MAKALFVANTVLRLPARDAGVVSSIVRVHSSRIGSVSSRKGGKLERREPVRIVNEETGAHTLRFAIGSGSMDIRSPTAIAADYDAFDALGISPGAEAQIGVYRAGYISVLEYYLKHPDWGLRLATHMGAGGLVFGIIGAALGIASVL